LIEIKIDRNVTHLTLPYKHPGAAE